MKLPEVGVRPLAHSLFLYLCAKCHIRKCEKEKKKKAFHNKRLALQPFYAGKNVITPILQDPKRGVQQEPNSKGKKKKKKRKLSLETPTRPT